MTITEIISKINEYGPNTLFLIPSHVLGSSTVLARPDGAIMNLQAIYDWWDSVEQETVFEIDRVADTNKMPENRKSLRKKIVYKITMTNDKLAEYAINMNVPNE